MVRFGRTAKISLWVAGIGAAILVLLSACSFLQASPYTDAVSLIQAHTSLSGEALSGTGGNPVLECDSDGTHEVVYLLQGSPRRLVILDSNLNTLYVGTNDGFGAFHAVGPSGTFIIGTMEFDPTVASPVPTAIVFPSGSSYSPDQQGYFDGTSYYHVFSLDSATLTLSDTTYDTSWNYVTQQSYSLTTNTDQGYYGTTVSFDSTHGAGSLVIYGNVTSYLVQFDGSGGLSSLTQPLLDDSSKSYTNSYSYSPTLVPVYGGVIIEDERTLTYKSTTSGSTTSSAITLPRSFQDYLIAASPNGEHIYLYNEDTQVLYRLGAWW